MSLTYTIRCSRHPAYKAVRRPKADCAACRKIWTAKQAPVVKLPEPDGSQVVVEFKVQ